MSSNKLWLTGAAVLAAAAAIYLWQSRAFREDGNAVVRVAIVPFANLSDDRNLDGAAWGLAASAVRQVEGLPQVRAFLAESENKAISLGATHIVLGTLEQRGGRVSAGWKLQSASNRRTRAMMRAQEDAAQWLALSRRLAAFVRSEVRPEGELLPIEVHTPDALRLFGDSMLARTPGESVDALKRAIASDPRCAACWESLIVTTAQNDGSDAARGILAEALQASGSGDGAGALRLQLLDATLRQDASGRARTLEKLAALLPSDPSIQVPLAEVRINQRRLPEAIQAYRRAWDAEPSRGDLLNQLGYANAWAGNYDEALRWIKQYEAAEPDSANPADSKGEVLMMAGRFTDAAAAFLASIEKDAAFNGGAAYEKAALARWMGGDIDGAGELVERFLVRRAAERDPLVIIRRARWQFLMGQDREALANLRVIASQRDAPGASLAAYYLTLFSLQAGKAEEAATFAALARQNARDSLSIYVANIAGALASGDGGSGAGVDPQSRLQLRAMALTLRGEFDSAAAAWEQALQRSPSSADGLPREMLAQVLVTLGQTQRAAAVVKDRWPLLTDDQRLLFDSLVYPGVIYVRGAVAEQANRRDEARRYFEQFLRAVGHRPDPMGIARKARAAARL